VGQSNLVDKLAELVDEFPKLDDEMPISVSYPRTGDACVARVSARRIPSLQFALSWLNELLCVEISLRKRAQLAPSRPSATRNDTRLLQVSDSDFESETVTGFGCVTLAFAFN
jgi:hypothetical protein